MVLYDRKTTSSYQKFPRLGDRTITGRVNKDNGFVYMKTGGRAWKFTEENKEEENMRKIGHLKHPIYFAESLKLHPKQKSPGPVMLLHRDDFKYAKREDVTHAGAFGSDYGESDGWILVWKFPHDFFKIKGLQLDSSFRPNLPVGTYSLLTDEY